MKISVKTLAIASMIAICANASAQKWAHVYTTSPDGENSMRVTSVQAADRAESSNSAIVLTNRQKQEIDGFGYALTYSTCYNLLKMSDADRANLLRKTFSPTDGYGVSYVRIAIGCCDFSSEEYTLCDTTVDGDPLRDFSLKTDELNYVIPVIREIQAINPNLKVIAAPWTAPAWMKVNCDLHFLPHYSFKSGSLNSKYYGTYGEYFVRFIKAFGDKGVKIYAVSPQNEPLNKNNNASMYMPWQEQADFVKEGLAPAIKNAGLDTKIYLFDHNYNYDNVSGQDDYPVKVFERMGTNFTGSDLVVGSCWHNYGGSPSELDDIASKLPGKEMIFTEASIGEWNNGRDLNARLADDMNQLIIETVGRGCRGSIVWNMMLDTQKGPHMSNGACETCYGAIDINKDDYRTLSYNSHYYVMTHASVAAPVGSHRIETEGWWTDNLSYLAFMMPNGDHSIVFSNRNNRKVTAKVVSNSKTYTITIPAKSVVTAVLDQDAAAPESDLYTNNTPGSATEDPAAGDLKWYVCGDYQGWNPATAEQMRWNGTTKRFELTVPRLVSGFKIINEREWKRGEWGAIGTPSIMLGEPFPLTDEGGKDILFYMSEVRDALLQLDPATQELTLTGTAGAMQYPDLVLSGDFTNPQWKLEKDVTPAFTLDAATGIYTIESYTFPQQYELKVVNASSWFPQWGSEEQLTPASEEITVLKKLNKGDADPANIRCSLAGEYRVEFDINKCTLKFTSASGVTTMFEDVIAGSLPKYYNLQGAKVERPERGVYLRVQGGTVSKEMK